MATSKVEVCLVASDGGHLNQLLIISKGLRLNTSIIVTEKSAVSKSVQNVEFLKLVNRKELMFIPLVLCNSILSLRYYWKYRPQVIISTGALSTVPLCIIGKLFDSRVMFIESFAKTNSPTVTGKLMYHVADVFFVQRESMLKFYPKAIFKGSLL